MREQAPRRTRHALTARRVQAIRAPGRYGDGQTPGLYVLIGPNGSKSWLLRTVVHGKRRDIGLGGVSVVSLADAREKAQRLRRIARSHGDPLADRKRGAVPSFESAAKKVHEALAPSFKNAKHSKQWLSSLDDVFSAFGAKPVNVISSADVLAALQQDWLTKAETSRRILQRLRVVFEWCTAQGFRSGDNPTQGVIKVLPKQRASQKHHPALPYAQVPAFIQRLREAQASASVRLAFEFAILTATRTIETQGAPWGEINLEAATWTIPAERMKTRIEHRVPLSQRSVEILKEAKQLGDGPFIFPGQKVGKPLSNMAFLMLLRRMEHDDITAHGFRSSFRDWAAERTNVARAVCEAALAHRVGTRTEQAYARTDLFERRRDLMSLWAEFATSVPSNESRGQ